MTSEDRYYSVVKTLATTSPNPDCIQIRAYRTEDLPQVEALEARIQPYRPEDEAEVQAMFLRARQAEQAKDVRWMPIPDSAPLSISEEYAAFWVAEREEKSGPVILGIVGVQPFSAGKVIPANLPTAQDWQARGNVAELRRLRVAPEVRRQGLGTRLSQTVILWCREQGLRTLVVNTTSPQRPALQLYRKLGFQESGCSFIDRYELVWLELPL